MKNIKLLILITIISVVPTLLVWSPFIARLESFWKIPLPQEGMATIVANYDGPLYIVAAKTLYNADLIQQNYSFNLDSQYYAAHFPLYPLLIRLLSIIPNTTPYVMLGITLASSVLALYFFNKYIKLYVNEEKALWLTLVFSILPGRWLIVRSVGSPEPLFMAAIIASFFYFKQKKYLYSALWGCIAQITKSPGLLLFAGYSIFIATEFLRLAGTKHLSSWKKYIPWKTLPLLLIPASLLGVFGFYAIVYGDFFAYFNSGDNIHLFFPPFSIFNYSAPWVGTFWLEEVILIYGIALIGLTKLIKDKKIEEASFVGIFLLSILFVSHRDVMRYTLPIVPFLIAGWSDIFTSREFKIVFYLLTIPVFLYSISFISQNVMPISDWTPFL